jgi:hypothetical protein
MRYIVVEHLFVAGTTVIQEDMTEEDAEELAYQLNKDNQDKGYRWYVACPEDPTPNE